jgi:hypothetical protein
LISLFGVELVLSGGMTEGLLEGGLVGWVLLGGVGGVGGTVSSFGGIKVDRRAPRAWRCAVECRCLWAKIPLRWFIRAVVERTVRPLEVRSGCGGCGGCGGGGGVWESICSGWGGEVEEDYELLVVE